MIEIDVSPIWGEKIKLLMDDYKNIHSKITEKNKDLESLKDEIKSLTSKLENLRNYEKDLIEDITVEYGDNISYNPTDEKWYLSEK